MRDLNPHARGQLILSQPCLPFHQFPVNNMVGAAWFEHAMILTRALVNIAPIDGRGCVYQFHQAPIRLRLGVEPSGNGGDPFHQTPNRVRAFDMDDRIHQNASCLSQSQEKYSRFPARTSGIFISCLLWLIIVLNHSLSHWRCHLLSWKRRTLRLPQLLGIATSLYWMAMFVAQLNMDSQRVGFRWLRVCLHDQQDSTLLL